MHDNRIIGIGIDSKLAYQVDRYFAKTTLKIHTDTLAKEGKSSWLPATPAYATDQTWKERGFRAWKTSHSFVYTHYIFMLNIPT